MRAPLLRRAAALAAALLVCGVAAAEPRPPRTVSDVAALLAAGRTDGARLEALKATIAEPVPADGSPRDLARQLWRRALALDETGREVEALAAAQQVLDLGGAWDADAERGYLSSLYLRVGDLEAARRNALQRLEGSQEANICARGSLIDLYSHTDPAEAQRWLEIDETEFANLPARKAGGGRHRMTGCLEEARSVVLQMRGRYAEAEAATVKAIAEFEADLPQAAMRAERNPGNEGKLLTQRRKIDVLLGRVAGLQALQRRPLEAEITMRQALRQTIEHHGSRGTATVNMLVNYASILATQGRTLEAEKLARLGVQMLDEMGAPVDSLRGIRLRMQLGRVLVAESRWADAVAIYDQLDAALRRRPGGFGLVHLADTHHALALIRTGRAAEAYPMLDTLLAQRRQWLGPQTYDSVEAQAMRGMAAAALGRRAEALADLRAAAPRLVAIAVAAGDDPSPLRETRIRVLLEAWLALLADLRGTPQESEAGLDAAAEAFRVADALRSQRTQAAVTASALRAAARDPALAGEIRREQDLAREAQSLQRILRDLLDATADQQLPKVSADMRSRIDAIARERAELQAGIARRFPAYANLVRPQPPTLAEARAALAPGEALLNLLPAEGGTFVWALRRDGPVAFARAPVGSAELAARVQALRRALDPGEVDFATGLPAFDLAAAYRLYAELLLPVQPGWQGATHWLVAASGPLAQLPLALLPTAPPGAATTAAAGPAYARYRTVPWLVREVATTQLPSVNALVTLRRLPAGAADRVAFAGFGDPQFTESPAAAPAGASRGLRQLAIARPTMRDLEQGRDVAWIDYGLIPPLPDTRDEILALAKALGADPQNDVFLGARASKDTLQHLDLSRRRVVAFATHGLLAGDFPGVDEPALALANPGGGRHGLLTLEDILGLKMDADWVVLSACNTAGGDGQGADALSGLGRAFFYAGSRALLVTHWPVESVSARRLVTGVFERQAADPALTRAEALRQSMLALMQADTPDGRVAYAHPLFWAPYALVGEGGR